MNVNRDRQQLVPAVVAVYPKHVNPMPPWLMESASLTPPLPRTIGAVVCSAIQVSALREPENWPLSDSLLAKCRPASGSCQQKFVSKGENEALSDVRDFSAGIRWL